MKPVITDTITQYRALLTNAEDLKANDINAEIKATKWYDEKPSLSVVKKKAQLEGKDMVIIETMTVTMETYDSKEE